MRRMKKMIGLLTLSLTLCVSSFTAYAYRNEDYDYEDEYEDEEYEDEYEDEDRWGNRASDREEYYEENQNIGWYQDANGKWHYKDINYEVKDKIRDIDGKMYYFDKSGVMLTDTFYSLTELGEIYVNYFGSDGAMVQGQIQKDGDWYYAEEGSIYVDPKHYLIRKGIVCDSGLYYIIDNFKMQTGIYNMDWDTNEYYDANARKTCNFPNKVGRNTIDLGISGGVYPTQLPVSNGKSKEELDNWLNDFLGNNTIPSVTNGDDEKFAMGERYIATALAEHGIYNYDYKSRVRINPWLMGGFSAVYYVYIPNEHSYKYLTIRFMPSLITGQFSYASSSI